MGDHDNGFAHGIQLFKNIHNLITGLGIQVTGRFVCHHDGRVVDQRPGDGHPLPLPAGQFVGLMVQTVLQSYITQGNPGPLHAFFFRHACIHKRQRHILLSRNLGKQIKILEHKPDFGIPGAGQFVVAQPRHFFPVQIILAGSGTIQTAQNIHHGGFAAAGRSHDGHKIPFFHAEVHMVQRLQNGIAHGKLFHNIFQYNDICHAHPSFHRYICTGPPELVPLQSLRFHLRCSPAIIQPSPAAPV